MRKEIKWNKINVWGSIVICAYGTSTLTPRTPLLYCKFLHHFPIDGRTWLWWILRQRYEYQPLSLCFFGKLQFLERRRFKRRQYRLVWNILFDRSAFKRIKTQAIVVLWSIISENGLTFILRTRKHCHRIFDHLHCLHLSDSCRRRTTTRSSGFPEKPLKMRSKKR